MFFPNRRKTKSDNIALNDIKISIKIQNTSKMKRFKFSTQV